MEKFTGKSKPTLKIGLNLHKPNNHKKRRIQMQDIGNACEIKRPTNLKNSCLCIDCYIKTSW